MASITLEELRDKVAEAILERRECLDFLKPDRSTSNAMDRRKFLWLVEDAMWVLLSPRVPGQLMDGTAFEMDCNFFAKREAVDFYHSNHPFAND